MGTLENILSRINSRYTPRQSSCTLPAHQQDQAHVYAVNPLVIMKSCLTPRFKEGTTNADVGRLAAINSVDLLRRQVSLQMKSTLYLLTLAAYICDHNDCIFCFKVIYGRSELVS